MTWTNAFDVGACTVKVTRSDLTVDFDATMVKGQTEDVPDVDYAGLTVSVSSVGVVALNNTGGGGIEITFEVAVLPDSLAGMDGARATLPTSGTGDGEASGNGANYIAFTNGDAAVDLSAMTPLDRISARPANQGSSGVSPLVQFTPEMDMPADYLVKRLQFEVDMEQDEDGTGPLPDTCVGVLAAPSYATGAFSPDYYSDDGDHSAILIESGTGALVNATLKASLTIIVYASGQAPPVLDQITVAYVGPLVLADSTPVDLTGFVQESQAGYRIGGLTARLDVGALVLGVTAIAGPTAVARAKITGEACFRGTYNGS